MIFLYVVSQIISQMPSISFMAFLPSPWPWPVPSLSSYKSSYAAPSAPSGSSCHSREPKRFVGEPPWPSFNHSATRYKWESNRGYLLRAVRRLTLRWKLQILSYFYSFQSFQSIFGLYMMKQYVVKLRKLFPQFYTVFFVFDVTPW